MSSPVSSRVRAVIGFAVLMLASFATACCNCQPCCKLRGCQGDSQHPVPGTVVVDPGASSNNSFATRSDGANPKIYGRARFQGTIVAFDVMSFESSPAQVEKLVINWTSHNNGTTPIAWPVVEPGDPLHTYTVPVPKTRWYVVDIPATLDASGSNDCFHIRIDAYDHAGALVISAAKKFTPGTDLTEYEQATDPM
jgi:hypothetical protein